MREIIELILLLALFIVSVIYGGYLLLCWFKYTPFYPSSSKDFKNLTESGKIKIKNSHFLDIGSGDGRIVHEASKLGATKAVGIEINPFLTVFAKIRAYLSKDSHPITINGDANNHDLSEFNIVYVYLFPEYIESLKDKFIKELKPGTIIISKVFKIKFLEEVDSFEKFRIYKIQK